MSVATIPGIEERHSREAIEAEIVRFEEKAQQLQSGAITSEQFRPFPPEARHVRPEATRLPNAAESRSPRAC